MRTKERGGRVPPHHQRDQEKRLVITFSPYKDSPSESLVLCIDMDTGRGVHLSRRQLNNVDQ